MPVDSSGYVWLQRRERVYGSGSFDRVAAAMRMLRFLRPEGLTVAVIPSQYELRVDQGPEWADPGARWAMLAVPPHASREHIALAIAGLAGVADVPFVVEALVAAERDMARS